MMARIVLPLLAVLLGGGLLFKATDGLRAVTMEGARRIAVAETQPAVPDVMLETMQGALVPLRSSGGETLLVEFVYTSCPVVCQLAASDFAEIRDRFSASGAKVRMISVSFDPQRDDPAAMAAYGEAHGADGRIWTVARPRPGDLNRLLDVFGVTVIPDEWLGFEHNAAIHVIDGTGRLVSIFDTDAVDAVVSAVGGGGRS